MRLWLCALLVCVGSIVPSVRAKARVRGLDIYFVDTEGGAATLIVTPLGESILIDCGNPGARDAERIHRTATELAGLKAIDHLIITHWHLDHYGGVQRLTQLMPIPNFYDRGIPDTLAEDPQNFPLLIQAYKAASKHKSRTLSAGNEIPLRQAPQGPRVRLLCLCARGEVIPEAPNAAANPVAKEHQPRAPDPSDNAKSLDFRLSF